MPGHAWIARSEIDRVNVSFELVRPMFYAREHDGFLKGRARGDKSL